MRFNKSLIITLNLNADQSSAQLLILNSQLSYLKTRYWQLTGLEGETATKARVQKNNGECFPRKQGRGNTVHVPFLINIFADCVCEDPQDWELYSAEHFLQVRRQEQSQLRTS